MMNDERLAEIEAEHARPTRSAYDNHDQLLTLADAIPELIAEVRRLRGKDQELDVLQMNYDEKVRLLEDVAPQLLSDPDLWDTMRSERDEAKAAANRLRSVLFAIGKMSAGGVREWALKEARSDD